MEPRYFRPLWRSPAYPDILTRCSWSPDGNLLAVPVHDGRLQVLKPPDMVPLLEVQASHKALWTAVWSPSGDFVAVGGRDNTAHLYELRRGSGVADLAGHIDDIHGLTWLADDDHLVTSSYDGTLKLWDVPGRRLQNSFRAHRGRIEDVLWEPAQELVMTAGRDGFIRFWDVSRGRLVAERRGHDGFVLRICSARRSRLVVTASSDATVKIWDRADMTLVQVLQGFTGTPNDLSMSAAEDLLAVKDDNSTIRIYRLDTFEFVDQIEAPAAHHHWYGRAAFHPTANRLVVTGLGDRRLELFEYPEELPRRTARESTANRYSNCRVGLLGNTGVGKTALARALRREEFVPTESTHGTEVSLMERWPAEENGSTSVREIYLWDFAGQPLYRLMQRLEVGELSVALLVLDSRNAQDPMAEIREWEILLSSAFKDRTRRPARILVVARADRGDLSGVASLHELREQAEDCLAVIATSARENHNIDELRDLVLRSIDWSTVPSITSDEQFQRMRMFLRQVITQGTIIKHASELQADYETHCARFGITAPSTRDFRALLVGLESEGLIRRLGFADFVLLQPSMLTSYASMLLLAAERSEQQDGGIDEEDIASARIPLLEGERVADARLERVLLHAAEHDFISAGVVLRDTSPPRLVFPSAVRRRVPAERWQLLEQGQFFSVRGVVDHVYATVVVLLQATGLFDSRELWYFTARFQWPNGSGSWLRVHRRAPGSFDVEIRHEPGTKQADRTLFENLAERQLARSSVDGAVTQGTRVVCRECGTAVAEEQVRRRRDRGFTWILCNVCGIRMDLVRPQRRRSPKPLEELEKNLLDWRAEAAAEAALNVKRQQDVFDVFISYAHADRDGAIEIARRLRENGIRPWLDVWEVPPGKPWFAAINEQINVVPAAAVLVGPSGIGPWQNEEVLYLLQQFFARRCPVVPVLMPGNTGAPPQLPGLLSGMQWVDFGREDPDPMSQLIWGITGVRR